MSHSRRCRWLKVWKIHNVSNSQPELSNNSYIVVLRTSSQANFGPDPQKCWAHIWYIDFEYPSTMFNAFSTKAMGKANLKSLKISNLYETNFMIQVWGFEFLALLFFKETGTGNLGHTKTKPNYWVWGKFN